MAPKEVVVKKVPTPPIVFYLGGLFLAAVGVGKVIDGKMLLGAFTILLGVGFVYLKKLEPRQTQVWIRISEERLWTRHGGNKPWSSIICLRFRYMQGRAFLDVYRSNDVVADEELPLYGINMSQWRLKRLLRKYTRVKNH